MNLPPIQQLISDGPFSAWVGQGPGRVAQPGDIPMNLRFFCKGPELVSVEINLRAEGAYLGIINALQAVKELLRSVDDREVDAKRLREVLLDLLALIESHNAI